MLAIGAVGWAMSDWSLVAAENKTAVLIYSELAALGVCLVVFVVAIRACYEERDAFDKRAAVAQKETSESGKENIRDNRKEVE